MFRRISMKYNISGTLLFLNSHDVLFVENFNFANNLVQLIREWNFAITIFLMKSSCWLGIMNTKLLEEFENDIDVYKTISYFRIWFRSHETIRANSVNTLKIFRARAFFVYWNSIFLNNYQFKLNRFEEFHYRFRTLDMANMSTLISLLEICLVNILLLRYNFRHLKPLK